MNIVYIIETTKSTNYKSILSQKMHLSCVSHCIVHAVMSNFDCSSNLHEQRRQKSY